MKTIKESENEIKGLSEIMTKNEVLNLFKIGTTTCHNWQLKKWLKPISIGSKIYFKVSDINDLIELGYSGKREVTNG